MSRRIDLTQELTEDERNYLLDRGWQHKLDENAMHLMGGGVDEDEIEVPQAPNESESESEDKSEENLVENPPAEDAGAEEQSEGTAPESAPAVAEKKPAPKGRGRK